MEVKPLELEDIIKRIASDVIHKMKKDMGEAGCRGVPGMEAAHRLLVLVPENGSNTYELLKFIADRHPANGLIVAGMSESDENAKKIPQVVEVIMSGDETGKQKILQGLHKFEKIYCVCPGIKLLEAIAEGDDTGFIENIMIKSVLYQKPAGVVLEYSIDNLPSNVLTKKIRNLISSIAAIGISVESIQAQAEEIVRRPAKGKELITEKDMEGLWKSGVKEIRCDKGCIVTPLARDRAGELGMSIIF